LPGAVFFTGGTFLLEMTAGQELQDKYRRYRGGMEKGMIGRGL
jgi:hypothetical protein